nr:MATE family efflux transporter [Halolactibacillus sp. JCM 19043]
MQYDKELFETMSIPKAVAKNSIPAIISMMVVFIYNIADTFFIGQTGDELQVAAITLSMPVFSLFIAAGVLLGIGGTSMISRALGKSEWNMRSMCLLLLFMPRLLSG